MCSKDKCVQDAMAQEGIRQMLIALGQDPERAGILDTPKRVLKAYKEMTEGYTHNPEEILGRRFDAEGYDGLVIVRGIRFTSLCEHHLLPFIGEASVAYLPGEEVVGLSKLPRLVECFARRLQLQEKMTQEIAEALETHLKAKAVGVQVRAQHQCMACRGVRQQDADMVTTTVLGLMRSDQGLKQEFIDSLEK